MCVWQGQGQWREAVGCIKIWSSIYSLGKIPWGTHACYDLCMDPTDWLSPA